MSTILVFIYAYKNKKIYNIVDLLLSKSSKTNNIEFVIFDQDNENKKDFYKKYKNLEYNHIFWDMVDGVSKYRNDVINKNFDYFLEVGNLKDIQENWDVGLIKCLETNSFISGQSNMIDFNFIFCNKNNANLLRQLFPLKHYGQDILLFYSIYINNLKLFKLDKDFYTLDNNSLLTSDYIPYSLTHKYYEKTNEIFNDIKFIEYCNNNNINIDVIKNTQNDIDYSSTTYNLDVDSQKFFNIFKTIRKVETHNG